MRELITRIIRIHQRTCQVVQYFVIIHSLCPRYMANLVLASFL